MTHVIKIKGQAVISAANLFVIVEGTQEFVNFKFELSDDWEGMTVFAQFKQNGVAYNHYLDENNMVDLPAEIVSGICTLTLRGDAGTKIGNTVSVVLTVQRSELVEDAESTVISQSLYQQLVDKVNDLIEVASGAKTYSEAAAESATRASTSETNALNSANAAAKSEENAKTSENNASASANKAENSASEAQTIADDLKNYGTEFYVDNGVLCTRFVATTEE